MTTGQGKSVMEKYRRVLAEARTLDAASDVVETCAYSLARDPRPERSEQAAYIMALAFAYAEWVEEHRPAWRPV